MARVTINATAIRQLATAPNGPISRAMRGYADDLKDHLEQRQRRSIGKVVYRVTAGVTRKRGQLVATTRMHPTRPHVIVPRQARVLVFPVRGQTVFAHRVNHPGSRPPKHYLTEAIRKVRFRFRR